MTTYDMRNRIQLTTQEKRDAVKALAIEMLQESHEAMIKKIDKALNSGAIDIDAWDNNMNQMLLPKCIAMAILQDEAVGYEPRFCSSRLERQIKKEVKNIRLFI